MPGFGYAVGSEFPTTFGDRMLYFAYGSNLDLEQMRARCPGLKVVGMAEMHDHKLAYPLTSHSWGGGVSSPQLAHGQSLWGAVYELTDADVEELDRYEGYRGPKDQHNVYDREQVFVELRRPDDGSIPRRVRVWCYFARPANPAPPSRRYLDAVLKGARAHRLPDDYIARLAATPTQD